MAYLLGFALHAYPLRVTFAKVLEWIPIWSYAKLVLLCWLSIFNGASYVYEHYLRPLMVNEQKVNVWYVPKGKDPLNKRDEVITAAEKYIQEHGTGELQYMLDNAEMHRRNGNVSSYYGYADEYDTETDATPHFTGYFRLK